jgi:transmembrane sensor
MEEECRMNPLNDDSTRVFQRATQWLSDLQDSKADSAALFRWLAESPRHVEEFTFALSLTDEIAGLTDEQCAAIAAMNAARRETPTVVPFATAESVGDEVPIPQPSQSAERRSGSQRRMGRGRLYAAAAVLLALGGALVWWNHRWQTFETDFGEQRVVDLDDGSVVHLNTESRIEVRFDGKSRDIRMISGEALFKVQHDPAQPFRVLADDMVIQAVGTQFNVHRRATGTTVSVLEGRVRVAAGGVSEDKSPNDASSLASVPVRNLSVGEEAEIAAEGRILMRQIDVRQAAAWRQRRLVFDNDTLLDIAAEFNRYNRRPQIRIEDARAGSRRFAATFDADAPEALLQILDKNPDLTVERIGDEIIVRSR